MKNTKIYLSIILTIIFAAMLCACGSSGSSSGSIFSSKTTIDAKNYISINFGKYDGYSSPEIEVDFEAMSSKIDVDTFNEFKNSFTGELKWELDMYDNRADVFDIDLAENYQNISNGDKIVVIITAEPYLESEGLPLNKLCDGLGINFKDTEIEYTVSGLEEPQNVIDIFGDIENYIGYNGTNGNGETYGHSDPSERRATSFSPVKNTDQTFFFNGVYFPKDYSRQLGDLYFVYNDKTSLNVLNGNIKICTIEYGCGASYLSEGDRITVKASSNKLEELEKCGYFVAATEKVIVVPDLGEYITAKEQLTENVIEQIKTQVEDSSYDGEICELYYVTLKPGVEQEHHSKACLVALVKKSSWIRTEYYYYYSHDVILEPDGEVISDWDYNSYKSKKTLSELREIFYVDMYNYELVKTFEVTE